MGGEVFSQNFKVKDGGGEGGGVKYRAELNSKKLAYKDKYAKVSFIYYVRKMFQKHIRVCIRGQEITVF